MEAAEICTEGARGGLETRALWEGRRQTEEAGTKIAHLQKGVWGSGKKRRQDLKKKKSFQSNFLK